MRCSTLASAVLLAALASACASPTGSADNGAATGGLVETGPWDFTVLVGPAAETLDVTATFPRLPVRELHSTPEAADFVRDVEAVVGDRWVPLVREEAIWRIPDEAGPRPRLRYRFELDEAAGALDDVGSAARTQFWIAAPPGTWLLRPAGAFTHDVRFRVDVEPPLAFATGYFRDPDGAENTYSAASWRLDEGAYSVFGRLETHSLFVGEGEIEVLLPARHGLDTDMVLDWIDEAANQVATYFDGFPVPKLLIVVRPWPARGLGLASAQGRGGAMIDAPLGRRTRPRDLENDWVMAHEMVHIGFPGIGNRHNWFHEGLASYVEPVARVRAGDISVQRFWKELVTEMPQGLPKPDSGGLNGTGDWGRTYWGGAMFCLLCDIEIRKRTGGMLGLEHAVREVNRSEGNISIEWEIDEVLAAAERGTGTTVLAELYAKHAFNAVDVDLDALWARLGVVSTSEGIRFDDSAPLADVRRAITGQEPTSTSEQ